MSSTIAVRENMHLLWLEMQSQAGWGEDAEDGHQLNCTQGNVG